MIEFGKLTFQEDLLRGGHSASATIDGVEIVVHAVKRRDWRARVWVDGISAGEASADSAHDAIRAAVRGQLCHTIRQLAALNKLEEE